jgi:hypothetical protein
MPVAHVSAVSVVMQAFHQQQALQCQQHVQDQAKLSALQNAAPSEQLRQLGLAQLNAFSAYQNAAPRNVWYHQMMVEKACGKGEAILDRIAFWSAVPCARWRLRVLADQLDAVSDEIERWAA